MRGPATSRRRTFSERLTTRKTDNAVRALPAKIEIRNNVLAAIGADKASVFDGFSGEGRLYDLVWHKAARYCGCDLKWFPDNRLAYVADNCRVLRAIDLSPFNIFDFDAYGSCWTQVLITIARRPLVKGEKLGLCLTEGTSLKLRFGSLPYALAQLCGLNPHLAGAAQGSDDIMERAIASMARRFNARILRRWEAHGVSGARMRYYGLILEGQ